MSAPNPPPGGVGVDRHARTQPIEHSRSVRQRFAGSQRTEVPDTTWVNVVPVVPQGVVRNVTQGFVWNRSAANEIFRWRIFANEGTTEVRFKAWFMFSGTGKSFPEFAGDLIDQPDFNMKAGDYMEGRIDKTFTTVIPQMWFGWYDEQ